MTGLRHQTQITLGFVPLLDASPLIVAHAKGFALKEGLDLRLLREMSWAALRDRISIGHIDAAHMPAPLPIATTLGLGSLPVELETPIGLATGGNAITVSQALWRRMREAGAPEVAGDPIACGRALKQVLEACQNQSARPLAFGVVHPFSSHNYELRHWLSAAGIEAERDVQITILPPPFMVDALEAGRIDGYCVGEPWNSLARQHGSGRIVTTKNRLWPGAIEKVLAMRSGALDAEVTRRLITAITRAADWCDDARNRDELAELLAQPDYMGLPSHCLLPGLSGALMLGDAPPSLEPNFLRFGGSATAPLPSQALWLYAQMLRWRQTSFSPQDAERAAAVYRTNLWCEATGLALPQPFSITTFDDVHFDAGEIQTWLAQYAACVE